jgi:hypothetical protein
MGRKQAANHKGEATQRFGLSVCVLVLLLIASALLPTSSYAQTGPALGVAGDFQIVSGAAITLGGAMTGLDTGNTSTSTPAIADLRSALASLFAAPAITVPADLGGGTYQPGTYSAVGGAAFAVTSNIILDGKNDCDSKFIFITPAAMNTTAGISITLINKAKANNVFWVVGGAITIAAGSNLSGNFLSSAAISVGAGSSLVVRLLALAAVTVGASVQFQGFPLPGCAAPVGGLSISAPESLQTRSLNPGESVVIELGAVTVNDTRGNSPDATWAVSTVCSELSDSSGNLLGGQNFSYAIKNLMKTGGLSITVHTLTSMSVLSPILSATSGEAINSATWIPVITVLVPVDQVAGTYVGSITHSVY